MGKVVLIGFAIFVLFVVLVSSCGDDSSSTSETRESPYTATECAALKMLLLSNSADPDDRAKAAAQHELYCVGAVRLQPE